MRLIDADLMASNLKDKAEEMRDYFPTMAEAFDMAADMIQRTPVTVDHKRAIDDAYKRGFIDGTLQQGRFGIK